MRSNFLRDKSGEEKYVSILMSVLLWSLVIAGVTLSSAIFYKGEYKLGMYESKLVSDKIVDCISSEGYLIEGFVGGTFDFSSCDFDFSKLEDDFFVRVSSVSSSEEYSQTYKFGKVSLEQDCSIAESIEAKKYPFCFRESLNLFYRDVSLRKVQINILVGRSNE